MLTSEPSVKFMIQFLEVVKSTSDKSRYGCHTTRNLKIKNLVGGKSLKNRRKILKIYLYTLSIEKNTYDEKKLRKLFKKLQEYDILVFL